MQTSPIVVLSAVLLLAGVVGFAQDEEAQPLRLEVEPSTATLAVGETLTLSAIVRDVDGDIVVLTSTIEDPLKYC